MSKLSPLSEFMLSLFYFTHTPQDKERRERLGASIDAWRRHSGRDAGTYTRQLVTAADRALSAPPQDLDKALAGIAEVRALAVQEHSMQDQADVARAKQGAEYAPPHTRWDERADLQ